MGGLRHLVPLVIAAGCQFAKGDPIADASGDSSGEAPQGLCFGGAIERVCLDSAPPMTAVISQNLTIETSSGQLCMPVASATVDACVIAGINVQVDGHITATGSRPLVLLAVNQLVVTETGVVDLSSTVTGMHPTGAAANGANCVAPIGPTLAGGAAGGSFGGRGGSGGKALNGGGAGGNASPSQATAAPLRGGCPGGPANGKLGSGGDGGGAVDFIAGELIEIDGIVNASGAGGPAGQIDGGGGAGAGGMIGIDAPVVRVTMTAQLFANGGGGGGGGATAGPGAPGNDPASASTQAVGGNGAGLGNHVGGDGGAGSVTIMLDGTSGGDGTDSGGGGGGGAGILAIDSASVAISGAGISPVPIRP